MKPIIAISSCIVGNKVRYDGGHTYEAWVNEKLEQFFELKAICPEMEMGLGAPRETMNLVDLNSHNGRDKGHSDIRLITTKTKQDLTELAYQSIERIMKRDSNGICGHIFQQRSPSCGIEQVKLYTPQDELINPLGNNQGLYAKEFIKQHPFVPVIESLNLSNIAKREHFLCRVMAYFRFHSLKLELLALQDFHARYEFILREHNQDFCEQLNSIASNQQKKDCRVVFHDYKNLFFKTLSLPFTHKNQKYLFLKSPYFFDPFPENLRNYYL